MLCKGLTLRKLSETNYLKPTQYDIQKINVTNRLVNNLLVKDRDELFKVH